MFKHFLLHYRWVVVLLSIVIALAAVLVLAGCTSGNNIFQAEGGEHDIFMTPADVFNPVTVMVKRGEWIEWTNTDTDDHSAIVDPLNPIAGGPDSDIQFPNGVQPGQRFRWRVPEDAVVGDHWFYHCRFHGAAGDGSHLGPGMTGEIIVK